MHNGEKAHRSGASSLRPVIPDLSAEVLGQLGEWIGLPRRVCGANDQLKASSLPSFDVSQGSPDLIDFLVNLDFMQEHSHLMYLFKLSCFCITSESPQYPAVSIGSVSTSICQNRLVDVVLPAQSYLSGVPDAFRTSDSSLTNFSLLSASFSQTASSASYDPWNFVDEFDRNEIYKTLLASYRSALSGLGEGTRSLDDTGSLSVGHMPAVVAPSDSKRRRMEKCGSRSRASAVVEDSPAGCSND